MTTPFPTAFPALPTPPQSQHHHSASSLAAVWKRDGNVQRVAIADLLDNPALQRWKEQPSITIRECILPDCPDAATCRFAHFLATTYVMGPPPVAFAEVFGHMPTSMQSVPSHHTFRNGLPPPRYPPQPPVYAAQAPQPPVYAAQAPQPPAHDLPFFQPHYGFQVPRQQQLLEEQYAYGRFPTWVDNVRNMYRHSLSLRPTHTCNLCCEEYTNQERMYTCDQKHKTCSECLTQYILTNWRDNQKANNDELRCCHTGCTSRPLTTQDVVRLVTSKAALGVYIDHTNRQTAAQCYAEAHAIVLKEAPQATSAADALLQKQLQKSMHAARMCPHCQFGPIDFFGCDDLAQHHGEKLNGARTKNSCPQCGYFSPMIQSWQRWDGVVRTSEDPVEQWSGADIEDESEYDEDEDEEYDYDDDGYYYDDGHYSALYGGLW